jgi:hypothetical protein
MSLHGVTTRKYIHHTILTTFDHCLFLTLILKSCDVLTLDALEPKQMKVLLNKPDINRYTLRNEIQ